MKALPAYKALLSHYLLSKSLSASLTPLHVTTVKALPAYKALLRHYLLSKSLSASLTPLQVTNLSCTDTGD